MKKYAEQELTRVADLDSGVRRCVMKLIEILISERPSGGSAPYIRSNMMLAFGHVQAWECDDMSTDGTPVYVLATMGLYQWACRYEMMWKNELRDEVIRIFALLGSFKPLSPLTGEDSEWSSRCPPSPLTVDSSDLLQSNRLFSIFKRADGTCERVDGILFQDSTGMTYTSGVHPARRSCSLIRMSVRCVCCSTRRETR